MLSAEYELDHLIAGSAISSTQHAYNALSSSVNSDYISGLLYSYFTSAFTVAALLCSAYSEPVNQSFSTLRNLLLKSSWLLLNVLTF